MFTHLFKIINWDVSINEKRTELMFSNGYECAYAYLDRSNKTFYFDRGIVPNYAIKSALSWALKDANMISVYSDNI